MVTKQLYKVNNPSFALKQMTDRPLCSPYHLTIGFTISKMPLLHPTLAIWFIFLLNLIPGEAIPIHYF
jgi:hypothetical protein